MEPTENPGRERILGRIRKALQAPASRHPGSTAAADRIFEPVADLLPRFQAECTANITECLVASETSAAKGCIEAVLASLPAGETFVQDAPEFRSMSREWQHGRSVRWSSEGGPSEVCQATLTLADALVASTGSILVSAACGGRGASVVAPCHIVLARLEQLVPDLDTAFAQASERGTALRHSFLGLITGSSRTADIEKLLVIGAHGPRRLVVIVQTGP